MTMSIALMVTIVFLIIYFGIILFSLAWSVAAYILDALGLQGVAKGLGLQNPWLAWIPFASSWNLGRIADKANEVEKGKKTSFSKWLLIGTIVLVGFSLLTMLASLTVYIPMFLEDEVMAAVLALVLMGFSMVMMVIGMAYTVLLYICYYHVFRLCCPDKAVMFLVVSIIISLPLPFFVFYCRNKVPTFEYVQETDDVIPDIE